MSRNFKQRHEDLKPICTWIDIFDIFKELSITQFTWTGLPSTIDTRWLELNIFERGFVSFFKDDAIGHLCLPCSLGGKFDVYGDATDIRIYSSNGYNAKRINKENCIIIFNNFVRSIPLNRLSDYAKRIWRIERTSDVNINAQKTPFLIRTDKNMELSLKTLYSQVDEFEPVVVVDKNLDDMSTLKVFPTVAPYIADKLEEQKRKLWNEALSYIGIENNYSEKSERLTKDEVVASSGLAISNRNAKLQARQQACTRINEMFGTSIWVENNNTMVSEIAQIEGGEDGE